MYDGKQVVRVETKYKQSDLYNIGKEMSARKGTGNYDSSRLQYNHTYINHGERNLYQAVKCKLNAENIEYLNKKNTNVLNGITFTSGCEFFESLGMRFKITDRTYQTGDKKGMYVKVPDINDYSDIPIGVSQYFDYCMEFLERYVGKDNIILSEVHYDEDTPHLQVYFIPVVIEVSRKKFLKDENGNLLKEKFENKKGDISYVPILVRDGDGKIVSEKIRGRFLNNDQFWKNKGGKNSFAMLQDEFNSFITDKGYNLDRGKVGGSKFHKTKLEYQIISHQEELNSIVCEANNIKVYIDSVKNVLHNDINVSDAILSPKTFLNHYLKKDVDKIIDYTLNLEKLNKLNNEEIKEKDLIIKNQGQKIEDLKNNELLSEKNKLLDEKEKIIVKQNSMIESLNNTILKLRNKLDLFIDKYMKLGKSLAVALKIKPKSSVNEYEDLIMSLNKSKDDFER